MREIDNKTKTVNAGRWRMAVKIKLCNMISRFMIMKKGNWERDAYQNAGNKVSD